MDDLSGKRAIVTGGASGIGRATAGLFARQGAAVCIADIRADLGQEVVDEIAAEGGRALFVPCDVTRAEDCQEVVGRAGQQFGGLDILFNSAGVIHRASVVDTSEDEWDRVMAVNVKSIFLFGKYAVPLMVESGGGAIINVSSGWGLVGGRKAVAYCASKGAVVLLTKAMALDHGSQNIRVNCICPGDTDTPLLKEEAQQLGQDLEGFFAEAADRPLKRIGQPEDIAQAALYLASDASAFVTGTTLVVDGGGLAG
jgi:NAD(P)-dependent dehydrogenase (short-subunit alcohol dehydrogenase family)